jgi:hypothetical protein
MQKTQKEKNGVSKVLLRSSGCVELSKQLLKFAEQK